MERRSALEKLLNTLKPTWDFRVLLLVVFFGWLASMMDPTGLAAMKFSVFVVLFWGMALLLRKYMTPYSGVKMSAMAKIARDSPVGAGLVYVANIALTIAIGLSFIIWWSK